MTISKIIKKGIGIKFKIYISEILLFSCYNWILLYSVRRLSRRIRNAVPGRGRGLSGGGNRLHEGSQAPLVGRGTVLEIGILISRVIYLTCLSIIDINTVYY